jgi:hypothetical protein
MTLSPYQIEKPSARHDRHRWVQRIEALIIQPPLPTKPLSVVCQDKLPLDLSGDIAALRAS